MKILLTGNCGFIGQNFVRLFNKDHTIIGLDKMGYASDKSAAKLCPTWAMDFSKDNLEQVFNHIKFDAIIHMGAESHVDNSINSPEQFMYSNYIGTFNLLEMAKKYKLRFLFIDTDEVYGDLSLTDAPFSDYNNLKPSSPYSASKAAAGLLVMSYHRTYGVDTVITRSCNNYGPFQYKEKFLPVVILNALNNIQIPVYGRGSNVREWIFVEDNCYGIMNVLQNGESGGIYNIGSGMEKSNLEMVKQILILMNKSENLIKFVEDRKGHDLRYAMDSSKMLNELKWEAKTHLINGLQKTIDWYIKNQNYWSE